MPATRESGIRIELVTLIAARESWHTAALVKHSESPNPYWIVALRDWVICDSEKQLLLGAASRSPHERTEQPKNHPIRLSDT